MTHRVQSETPCRAEVHRSCREDASYDHDGEEVPPTKYDTRITPKTENLAQKREYNRITPHHHNENQRHTRRLAKSVEVTLDKHAHEVQHRAATTAKSAKKKINILPKPITNFFKWSGAAHRKQHADDMRDADNSETPFDSPLQQTIKILSELAARLRARSMHHEAQTVAKALRLLSSGDLHDARSLAALIEQSGDEVDPQLAAWLAAMEWITIPKRRGGAAAADAGAPPPPPAAAAAEPLSTPAVAGSPAAASADADAAEAFAWLCPSVRPLLRNSDEARVLRILEHDSLEWQFDGLLELERLTGGNALVAIGWALFERHGIVRALRIDASTLCNFLRALSEGYNDVPYHCSAHAACVAHGLHYLLAVRTELFQLWRGEPLELVAPLFAALVHDLGHTGQNNAFHVATSSELALRYSDQSVLEYHHLASAWSILGKSECALLKNAEPDFKRRMRQEVVGMVLATDLAVSIGTINQFKAMLADQGAAAAAAAFSPDLKRKSRAVHFNAAEPPRRKTGIFGLGNALASLMEAFADPERGNSDDKGGGRKEPTRSTRIDLLALKYERIQVLKMALKVADIGNVTKGKSYAIEWTERVTAEFFLQGDLEKKLGCAVTPMMDRGRACVAKQQLGFYMWVVRPMLEAFDCWCRWTSSA